MAGYPARGCHPDGLRQVAPLKNRAYNRYACFGIAQNAWCCLLIAKGDEQAGKSALLHRLQGKKHSPEDPLKGTGLEYSFVDVKDEDADGWEWSCSV